MANEKQINFNIGAALAPSFKSAFGDASKSVIELEKISNKFKVQQIQTSKEMEKLYKNIDTSPEKLKKIEQAMSKNREEATRYREKLLSLRNQMKNGNEESTRKEYEKLRKSYLNLNREYKNGEKQKTIINNQTTEERKRVNQLIDSYQELEGAIKKADRQKRQYARADKISKVGRGAKNIGNKAIVTGGIGIAAFTPIMKETIDAESAFADVKKQFDFATYQQEQAFREKIHSLIKDKKMAVSLPSLYGAVANAGQSGVGQNEAVEYTEQSIKMGIAFDMTQEQAADSMFKMKNSLKLPLEDLKILIDQINYLSNTTGSTAPEVTDFLLRIGNIAKTANLSASSVSALGATLIEQGIDAEKAATGVKNLILTLTSGKAATKSQAEGFKVIGLNPEQVAKDMQKNAEKTIKKVFQKLNKLKPEEKTSVMQILFGKEALQSAAGTMANLDNFLQNLENVRNKSLYGGSAEKEYQTRAATTQNNIQATIGQTQLLSTEIGTNLLPLVNQLLAKINGITGSISDYAKSNPEDFKEIVNLLGEAVPLMLAFGAAMQIGGTIVTVTGAIAKLVPIITSLNLAMLANPATLVAAGIATVVASIYALISNWDKVSGWFKKWFGIKDEMGEKNIVENQGISVPQVSKIQGGPLGNPKNNGISYGATQGIKVQPFANGGIVTKPTLGLVGEAGYSEAVIPLNKSKRSLSLFKTTERILGESTTGEQQMPVYNPVFNITIQGEDTKAIKDTIANYERGAFEEFKRNIREFDRDKSRRRG